MKILVICTGNSCRSQMMHGWLKHFGKQSLEVYSAGVQRHGLNLDAVYYMNEVEIDISSHQSNLIEEYLHIAFDLILTVCDHANETCPTFPSNTKQLHHNFEDPSKVTNDKELAFRKVRDEIRDFAEQLVVNLTIK